MIVDSSAVIAILREESDARDFASAIRKSDRDNRFMSTATFLECNVVLSQPQQPDGLRNPILSRRLDRFITMTAIRLLPVTEQQARTAAAAYWDFGRGSGHPAKLNFGDCFSYAAALDTGEPLLWKGDDFTSTGIPAALG